MRPARPRHRRSPQIEPLHPAPIRVNLTMPVTCLGFGLFSFAPVEQLVGAPLSEVRSSQLVAAVQLGLSLSGPPCEVYALALPPGGGASVPLGHLGELGLANQDGLLVLTATWGMGTWLREKLGEALVSGPEAALSLYGMARRALAWVRLRQGMRASFPVGGLGRWEWRRGRKWEESLLPATLLALLPVATTT